MTDLSTREILIVEDNPDHFEIMRRLIMKSSETLVNITWFPHGQNCLDYLAQTEEQFKNSQKPLPYLALIDLNLPGADGIEILKRIKKSEVLRSMIVIIVSSSQHKRDILMAYQNHTNSYLIKPSDLAKFTELIGNLQTYWMRCNQPPNFGWSDLTSLWGQAA